MTNVDATGTTGGKAGCGAGGNYKGRLLSEITSVSTTSMIADRGEGDRSWFPNNTGVFNNDGSFSSPGPNQLGGNPSYRHLNTTNVLYVDGHVKSMQFNLAVLNAQAVYNQ